MLIGFALIAYPLYLGVKAYRLPAIYDITTDPIDPPQFDAIARLRPRDANPTAYAGLYTAEQQNAAYPDIAPDDTTATPQEAYNAAMKVIAKRRWRVVDARPPQAALPRAADARALPDTAVRDGIIEAVARTPILGFRDDVVVRVRATPDGARIDVRSASRYGRNDLGTNASRVSNLIDNIDDVLSAPVPEKKPAPPPHQPAGQGVGQAINAVDRRRAFGRDHAARHQIFHMRQHRQSGGAGKPRVEPDIDRLDDGRDVGCALAEPVQDRSFAALAVADQKLHVARSVAHRHAMAGEVERLAAARQLVQRRHVVAHGAVGRRHDRGRPAHDMIAGEQQIGFLESERHVIGGMARRRHRFERPAVAATVSPSASATSGRKSMSAEASSRRVSPICSGRASRCGPCA